MKILIPYTLKHNTNYKTTKENESRGNISKNNVKNISLAAGWIFRACRSPLRIRVLVTVVTAVAGHRWCRCCCRLTIRGGWCSFRACWLSNRLYLPRCSLGRLVILGPSPRARPFADFGCRFLFQALHTLSRGQAFPVQPPDSLLSICYRLLGLGKQGCQAVQKKILLWSG